MARNFRTGRGSQVAPKRQIANDGFGGRGLLTFGAALTATAVGSFAFVIGESAATIVRTRGWLNIRVNSSGTINNPIHGAMGMMIVGLEAFNVGITALATPLDDIERAWFVWQPFTLIPRVAAASAGNDISAHLNMPFDSRGQRRVKEGDVLVVMFEATQLSATTGTVIECSYGLRLQAKL